MKTLQTIADAKAADITRSESEAAIHFFKGTDDSLDARYIQRLQERGVLPAKPSGKEFVEIKPAADWMKKARCV